MIRWIGATIVLFAVFTLPASSQFFKTSGPFGYRCVVNHNTTGKCEKDIKDGLHKDLVSLETCKLTCGTHGRLWPMPTSANVGNKVNTFLPFNIGIKCNSFSVKVCQLVDKAFSIFMLTLDKYHPEYSAEGQLWMGPHMFDSTQNHQVQVVVGIEREDLWFEHNLDESYTLVISSTEDNTTVKIAARTFFGARHALETLSQLIDYHEGEQSLQIVRSATIVDAPVFTHRGISVDTSRNFISIKVLKRILDAMSYDKLNIFHWHISDSTSFPLQLPRLPKVTFWGAYSAKKVYHPAEVRELVEYAQVRGIRIIPEIDAPAHVGAGWEWGEREGLGKLTVCFNREPWQKYCVQPPCGQLNLANENMYTVLGEIFRDVAELFEPLTLFHYGGDEVNVNCYNTSQEIVDLLNVRGYDRSEESFLTLWAEFQLRAEELLTVANKGKSPVGILWTSGLTKAPDFEKRLKNSNAIIQVWESKDDPVIASLLRKNYRLIFSNYDTWYLDCGFGAWVGDGNNWCSPYKGWQTMYDHKPYEVAISHTGSPHKNLILGGESAIWSEQVDDMVVEARLWPRSSAVAERLWTNPVHGYELAEERMLQHRQRHFLRGTRADRLKPYWCLQNEELCYVNKQAPIGH